MKTYLIKLSIFVVCLAVLQSCDNYLEETNPNEISADTYWENLDQSDTNLTSVYGAMLNSYIVGAREEAWRSDMAFPGNRDGQIKNTALNLYNHIITEDNEFINQRWSALYQVIFRANQVIEGLNGMTDDLKTDQRWTEQMGQARFFRGLSHFYLHTLYNNGKIVIRDVIPATQAEFSKPLSSSEEVMDFFRADLQYAYENLPATFSEKTRVTAGTAATILGTSYLYSASEKSEDYQKAKTYFEDIINNNRYGYSLVQDAGIMFTAAGDFNSESIFEINYAINQQIEDDIWDEESFFTRSARYSAPKEAGGSNANEQFTAASWLVHTYATEPLNMNDPRNTVIDRGTGAARPRKVSLRASAMIAMVNDEHTKYYGSPSAPVLVNFGNQGKYGYFKKYTNHDIVANENETGDISWKSGKNVIVNRLADVYLMYAECLLIGDHNIQGAIDYINPVRERWGLQLLDANADLIDGTPYSVKSLMDHLMYVERPLELSVEGVSTRIIDLRRWGVASERFADLSSRKYYLVDYDYYDDKSGSIMKRKNSLVKKGLSPDPNINPQIVQEYKLASQFYSLGYFPLPTIETLNNKEVSGVIN